METSTLISIIVAIVGSILLPIYIQYLSHKKNKDALDKWKEDVYQDCGIDQERRDELSSKEFIRTKGQFEAPHDYKIFEDDDNNNYILKPSENNFDLIDKIMKGIFSKNRKRYIILSGSGMGKTYFSSALVHFYLKRIKSPKEQYPIYLHQFGKIKDINTLIQNKQTNSILILDALDENIEAVQDPVGYMQRLEQIVDKFRVVIITCRTQFFANEEDEPQTWSVIQSTPGHQSLVYEKFYLSPIEDEDIKKYLEAKYDLSENYRKAIRIKDRTQDLMRRPLFLASINNLLPLADSEKILIVDIYKKIIEGMLDFERRKCQHESFDEKKLFDFSKKIALLMYDKWVQGKQEYYLTPEEFKDFYTANGYNTNPFTLEEGALLNRNGRGYIQFSHKSFWEFLIAICAIENPYRQFNPTGLPLAVVFYRQIHKLFLKNITFDCVKYYDQKIVKLEFNPQYFLNELNSIEELIRDTSLDDKSKGESIRNRLFKLNQEFIPYLPKITAEKLFICNSNYIDLDTSSGNAEKVKTIIRKFIKIRSIDTYFNSLNACDVLCKLGFYDLSLKKLEEIITFFKDVDIFQNPMASLNKSANKEILLYPIFSTFTRELIDGIISKYNFISVGSAFCNNESIIYFVSFLVGLRNSLPIIIYHEDENIDNHADFILKLSEELFNDNKCDTCTIILVLKIDSKHPLFVINHMIKNRDTLLSNLKELFLNA